MDVGGSNGEGMLGVVDVVEEWGGVVDFFWVVFCCFFFGVFLWEVFLV